MAIIKCKMCGGDLLLVEGQSVAECEYCGSRQTVPLADNEKKLTLFARANRLRASCEFDKAAGIYEAIVADFSEEAEAYWGLVLCKYGIEYVDDPATGKKIPTCHRSSFDSILDDSDFEQALENADSVARRVYREEAKQIEEIRKGIVSVSANEQPYDIFICYKETDENGDRTLDSVLAQDIYDLLTEKGYRTFFARISLEDKLGQEYEPYIFAALHSAKIMLAVGTDYEFYNAVWVKNEWSRYLKLMTKDKTKHLIPCYKGIDAYDMPREFTRLQAQDLSKVGALQDLLRGIEKIIPKQKNTSIAQERAAVGGSGHNKIASLLDRGNMALEDGDWAKADSFFEEVLNNDSKNAQAYLGKTLVQEKSPTLDTFIRKRMAVYQLAHGQELPLQENSAHVEEITAKYMVPGYFEEKEIRELYHFELSCHSDTAERQQQYRNEQIYWANHKLLSRAEKFATGSVAENLQAEKTALFVALNNRVKAAQAAEAAAIANAEEHYAAHLKKMDGKAKQLCEDAQKRREAHYEILLQIAQTSADVGELLDAAGKFERMGDYRNSKKLAEHCHKRAGEEQAKLDKEAERQRILAEKKEKARRKRNKTIAIATACVICAAFAFVIVLNKVIIPSNKYNDAIALMNAEQYTDAIEAFEAMDGYRDSAGRIVECQTAILDGRYNDALALMDAKQYTDAIEAFEAMDGYRDSVGRIAECQTAILDGRYNDALALMDAKEYTDAIEAFEALDGYQDSLEKINDCEREILKLAKVGDTVFFGTYEQDNNQSNGKEKIKWHVLDRVDGRLFVVSHKALDSRPYHKTNTNVTWETCSLRTWLNKEFLNSAFSASEKAMIPTVTVPADRNPEYTSDPGKATKDKIFLLGLAEAEKYIYPAKASGLKYCRSSYYAYANGVEDTFGDLRCDWWLRAAGEYDQDHCASCIDDFGRIKSYHSVSYDAVGVRPALWINLNT